jgi:hypothetical protein
MRWELWGSEAMEIAYCCRETGERLFVILSRWMFWFVVLL